VHSNIFLNFFARNISRELAGKQPKLASGVGGSKRMEWVIKQKVEILYMYADEGEGS
jgi:hypothetical protein